MFVSKMAGKKCLELNAATRAVDSVTCSDNFAVGQLKNSNNRKPYFVARITSPDVWYGSPEMISHHLVNLSTTSEFVVLSFDDTRCPKLKSIELGPNIDTKTSLRAACDREKCEFLSQGLVSYETSSLQWWYVMLRGAGLQPIHSMAGNVHGCQISAKTVERPQWCGESCDVDSLPLTYEMISHSSHGNNITLRRGSLPSCALVLNSGILKAVLNPALGPMIDAHSHVIRLNDGPAGKVKIPAMDFTKMVGKRTNFRVAVAYEFAYQRMAGEIGLFNIYGGKAAHDAFANFTNGKQYEMGEKAYEIPESFRSSLSEYHAYSEMQKPSTGLLALFLALHACEKVSVFGKSLSLSSVDMSTYDAHYWDSYSGDIYSSAESSHAWDLEQRIYEHLDRIGAITTIP